VQRKIKYLNKKMKLIFKMKHLLKKKMYQFPRKKIFLMNQQMKVRISKKKKKMPIKKVLYQLTIMHLLLNANIITRGNVTMTMNLNMVGIMVTTKAMKMNITANTVSITTITTSMIIIIMITVMSFMKNGESMVVMKVNITATKKVVIMENMEESIKEKEMRKNMVIKKVLRVVKVNLSGKFQKRNGGWSVTIGEVGEKIIGDVLI